MRFKNMIYIYALIVAEGIEIYFSVLRQMPWISRLKWNIFTKDNELCGVVIIYLHSRHSIWKREWDLKNIIEQSWKNNN